MIAFVNGNGLGQPTALSVGPTTPLAMNRLLGIKTFAIQHRRSYAPAIMPLTGGLFTADQIRRIIMGISANRRGFHALVTAEMNKSQARLGQRAYFTASRKAGSRYGGAGEIANIIWYPLYGSISKGYVTKEDFVQLAMVALGPTPAELADLTDIDNFFGVSPDEGSPARWRTATNRWQSETRTILGRESPLMYCFKRRGQPLPGYGSSMMDQARRSVAGACAPAFPGLDDPFWYPPGIEMPPALPPGMTQRYASQIKQTMVNSFSIGINNKFWKLNTGLKWRKVKSHVANAKIVQNLWWKYPWPVPMHYFFLFYVQSPAMKTINEIVKQDNVIDPESYRTILTLSILEHYDIVVTRLNSYLKKKAKKKKRKAIVKAVLLVVVGIIFAAALPAVLALAYSAGKAALDATKKRAAARDLVKVAKQFESDNAAFAAEIMRVADELDAEAAAQEAAEKESEEETAALIEGEGEFILIIEGKPVLKVEELEVLIKEGIVRSVPGDRVEATFEGKPTGLYIRTKTTLIKVPPEAEAGVRQATREEIFAIVQNAEARVKKPKEAGFPWWVLIPAAAVIL